MSDTIGVMYFGKIVESGTKSDIFKNPVHPYTQALFSAIPIPDPEREPNRIVLGGDVPSPTNPPKGCRFGPRCPKASEGCDGEPEMVEVSSGHYVARHLAQLSQNEETKKEPVKLEWKDYVATTIAALQAVLLPVVILFMVILVFAVAFGVLLFR